MSLLLLFHGSAPPVAVAPWRWNGLLLPLHNPYSVIGTAPYLSHGVALSFTVHSAETSTVLVHSGQTSTAAVKTGIRQTVKIVNGAKDAVIL